MSIDQCFDMASYQFFQYHWRKPLTHGCAGAMVSEPAPVTLLTEPAGISTNCHRLSDFLAPYKLRAPKSSWAGRLETLAWRKRWRSWWHIINNLVCFGLSSPRSGKGTVPWTYKQDCSTALDNFDGEILRKVHPCTWAHISSIKWIMSGKSVLHPHC